VCAFSGEPTPLTPTLSRWEREHARDPLEPVESRSRSLFLALGALIALAGAAPATEILPAQRRSGFDAMSPETQAMQRDDGANPGMLWVQDGADLWNRAPSPDRPACAGCHGEADTSMRGVAARYPAFDAGSQRPVDLQDRINLCRREKQNATPFAYESRDLLGLSAYVATQSRGEPIAPPKDPRLHRGRAEGQALFTARMGQLGLTCAACHDDNHGRRLGAATIPQGHPTGYPLYRLEWQGIGSLQRRLRNCMTGMRAEPYPYGAPEHVALELYLATRAAPLPVETPAVRP
jgi:sulfur-oxidizing protein SoxA